MSSPRLRSHSIEESTAHLERIIRIGTVAGLILLVLFVLSGFLVGFQQFFRSYLFAYLFIFELALGSLAIVMVHYLVGGGWGMVIRRPAEAGAKTVWLVGLLFIPLLFGLGYLYPWAQPEVVAADATLQFRQPYLNLPFFIIRAAIYFAVWLMLVWRLTRWANKPDYYVDPEMRSSLQRRAALGLILYSLMTSFASIDWIMSLDPHWFSMIYPLLIIVSHLLAGLSLAIALTPFLASRTPLGDYIRRLNYRDLGAMLLSFVLIWAYIAFSQYIIIWGANIPHDVTWFLDRTGPWTILIVFVIVVQFVLPFLILLSLWAKRNPTVLSLMAFAILAMRILDYYWHVMPSFSPGRLALHWMDFLAPLAFISLWIAAFSFHLRRTPLLLLEKQPKDIHGPAEKRTSVAS
jgi:hypothetical protein